MKKKLLLIKPDTSYARFDNFYEPIEMGIIANLTPKEDWSVEILDMSISSIEDKEADLVAITARISTANNAYNTLEYFKNRGIKTIIGGAHPSLCPHEAVNYADSVVIGPAESVWHEVLKDFNNNELKDFYNGSTDLNYSIDRSIYSRYYKSAAIQMSRGCPLSCDFCCVGKLHNNKHYFRDIDNIVSEIKTINQKLIAFTDENMYGFSKANREQVLTLFKTMVKEKLNKHWFGMASINAGEDDEYLYWARKSGCRLLLIGVEAEDERILLSVNKKINAKHSANFKNIFKNIHKHRIAISGSFIIGLESDTIESIHHRMKYIINSSLDVNFICMFTPFPGSKVFDKLVNLNKLIYNDFPKDWEYFNQGKSTFKHENLPNMDEDMIKFMIEIRKTPFVTKKFFKTIFNTRSISAALYANLYNYNHFRQFDKAYLLKFINNLFESYQYKYYKRNLTKIK